MPRSEMAGLEGFEFFDIIIEKSCSRQRLPDKFAKMLDGREPQKVKLRGAGRLWDVLVVFDADGHMYLGPGWKHFTRAHDLQLGHFLVFHYDCDAMLTVKVFDNTMCHRYYQHDDDASNGSSSGDDEEQSGEEEEQSGEVQPIVADDDLDMVVADDDLTMVVPVDDLAMVVPDDDLAMVVAPVIP